MKLKYYLKGFGIGVIFATLILSVSFYIKKESGKSLSKQEIESLATAYGMVYTEETTEEEMQQESSDEPVTMRETETTRETESIRETETTRETESIRETTTREIETQTIFEAQTSAIMEGASVEQKTITIVSGMNAREIAYLLQEAGIISDAEDFRRYIVQEKYSTKIRTGVYTFTIGTDYETIIEEFTKLSK